MGKRTDLSDFDKGQIVGARRAGSSISQTAELVGCSRAAVVKVYQDWRQNGHTTTRRQNCKGQRTVDVRGERRVRRLVQANRRSTVQQLTTQYNMGQPRTISGMTMRRTLARMGYNSRRPLRHPLLTTVHRRKRLAWCKEHASWTLADWKKVCWSDESRFLLHSVDGRVRIWRQQHEALDPSCMVSTVQAGGGGCMVWGMFTWQELGPLVHVEQRITGLRYRQLLADCVHPAMLHLFPNGDGVFQDDNAPCHRAHVVQDWFEEHSSAFQHIDWPPNSPDINPIEHLWDTMERHLRRLDTPIPSIPALQAALHTTWLAIPPECFRHLVESMPRRIAAVLRAKGGPTRY